MNNKPQQWDIFCKLVDNFGDIGVCWRLAKQLSSEYGFAVQLYVDNFEYAQKIIPKVNSNKHSQNIDSITLSEFSVAGDSSTNADVVIEAFACGLPEQYQANMHEKSTWINLEYLSAEPWVVDFHAKHSKFSHTPLLRHFYFPGFQPEAGGLLREQGLIAARDRFIGSEEQSDFMIQLGLTNDQSLTVSLFAYESAPINTLFEVMAAGSQKITVLAPLNSHLHAAASFFDQDSFTEGQCVTKGQLTLHVIPFLSQQAYDHLLWSCDINFVRGEDSWVRAVWSGKPFIWQPYVQTEESHLTKLDAFLNLYYQDIAQKDAIAMLHSAWSTSQLGADLWDRYLMQLPAIKQFSLSNSAYFSSQQSLAEKLVAFCANIRS